MERPARVMAQPSKKRTSQLLEEIRNQHMALAVAAGLARTQLIADPVAAYDAQHLSDMLDLIAVALAKVAPLHVPDAKSGLPRQMSPLELEGASFRRGATLLVLQDGTEHAGATMTRGDLRHAVAVLKAVGMQAIAPQYAPAKHESSSAQARAPAVDLEASVGEIDSLLHAALDAPQLRRIDVLATRLARGARDGRIANCAMQLMSAVYEARASGDAGASAAVLGLLGRLKAAIHDLQTTDRGT